jgi:putative ABC transport system permease protein
MLSNLLLQLKLLAAHFRRHRARLLLTLLAIVIGVASVSGILVLNRSAYASFESAVASVAGRAQFEVANGAVGVPVTLLPRIRATPGVYAAAGVVQEFVRVPKLEGRRVALFGVDLAGDSRIWKGLFDLDTFEIEDELELTKDPRAVLLSDKLVREGGYATAATIEVTSPLGKTELTVRGSFRDQRFARVFQGDVALMDTLRAQALFGKQDRFDWIQVEIEPDAELEMVEKALQEAVSGYAQVASPRTRGKRVESMLRSNRWMLTLSSLFAAAVGLFLVAQSMYTSTEQRGTAYATLRCLGATRGQLATHVLLEAAILAVVGSLLGIAAGLAFCKLALGPFGAFLSTTYVQVKPAELVISVNDLIASLAVGIGATLGGSLIPAVAVTSIPPIDALRRSLPKSRPLIPRVSLLGFVLFTLGMALPSMRLPREWFAAQTAQAFAVLVLVLIGAALVTPIALRLTGVLVRPLLIQAFGGVGSWLWNRMAAGGRRTILTIAALAAGFSFATLNGLFIASYRTAVVDYLESSFPADVIVNVGPPMSMLGGPVASLDVMREVEQLPHVLAVSPIRFVEATFAGNSIIVQGIGDHVLRPRFDRQHVNFERGEVVISDTLMERYGLEVGKRFTLDTPTGPIELTVKTVEADYFLDLGSVKLPWSVFNERWREDKANVFLVELDASGDPAELKALIDSRLGDRYDLTVLTRNDTRVAINALIDSTFALMFLCEGLAILVAVIAVTNGVAGALLDRVEQLHILRAVGLTPRGLRTLVLLEGAVVGLVGGAIGVLAGSAGAYRICTASWRTVAGFHMTLVWPVMTLGAGLVAAVLSGILAGYLALRGSMRASPIHGA